MKHISLSPSTELAEIAISVMPFRTTSLPRSLSPSCRSVHRASRICHLPRASHGNDLIMVIYFGCYGSTSTIILYRLPPTTMLKKVEEVQRKIGDDECIAVYTYGELDLKDN
ncbi:hypothetical protein ACE6H2_026679 [Prunus campanulata]